MLVDLGPWTWRSLSLSLDKSKQMRATTLVCTPSPRLLLLPLLLINNNNNHAFSSAFQQPVPRLQWLQSTCSAKATSAHALRSSFNDFDDLDRWDDVGDDWIDDEQQQQLQYNNFDSQWDGTGAAQFPTPPPRPYFSSNLRNNIASTTPSPYDNPSWTKSSRYGNRNVNFNSRSNRVNTFDRNMEDNPYDKYIPGGPNYGRETYRNSSPDANNEYNSNNYYQSQYKGYPSRTTYTQDDNYATRRRFEDANTNSSPNRLSKKLYRDYDYDDDPNRSRGGSYRDNEKRFNDSRNISNNNFFPTSRPPQYRDYDDVNYAPSRSYRDDKVRPNNSNGNNINRNNNMFPPRPQYRDYDDPSDFAPSRSYRRENQDGRDIINRNNNGKKFPPSPPRRSPQPTIPNNFASPRSNRSDSPSQIFPPGVGSMGYNPPSEYIPQSNDKNRGPPPRTASTSSTFRGKSLSPNDNFPPPIPQPQSRYNNNNNNFNDNMKYQYDVNRREKYIDDELIRSQTQYNFPNGDVIRKERIDTLRPIGFNSIFSDIFSPFQQMLSSAAQSLNSSDMLKEARLRILDNDVVLSKLGEPIQVSTPFSQSSSMSNMNGQKASKVRARFQVAGPYGTGVATMDSIDGEIRSLVVDLNGSTVRIGPRQQGDGVGGRRKKKNVVEAEILDESDNGREW